MRTDDRVRLANIVSWLRTAKECLPATSDGVVDSERVAAASALIDRMHRVAAAMTSQAEAPRAAFSGADLDRTREHFEDVLPATDRRAA